MKIQNLCVILMAVFCSALAHAEDSYIEKTVVVEKTTKTEPKRDGSAFWPVAAGLAIGAAACGVAAICSDAASASESKPSTTTSTTVSYQQSACSSFEQRIADFEYEESRLHQLYDLFIHTHGYESLERELTACGLTASSLRDDLRRNLDGFGGLFHALEMLSDALWRENEFHMYNRVQSMIVRFERLERDMNDLLYLLVDAQAYFTLADLLNSKALLWDYTAAYPMVTHADLVLQERERVIEAIHAVKSMHCASSAYDLCRRAQQYVDELSAEYYTTINCAEYQYELGRRSGCSTCGTYHREVCDDCEVGDCDARNHPPKTLALISLSYRR